METKTDLPPWDGIGLPDNEAAILAERAADRLVLEVGSWLGRSTIAMARTAKLVVAVDPHVGPPVRSEGPTCNEFLANLRAHGVSEKVAPFVAPFSQVAGLLRSEFEMAFIDGAHDGISVLRDGRLAYMLMRLGSPLVFHDYETHTAVTAAVHELAARWGQKHEQIEGSSLAVLYKR